MTTRLVPNFFIVGAPKCGTTAMAEYLRQHPHIFMCLPKEPHYFSKDLAGHREIKTWDVYANLFAGVTEEHLAVGEASVFYMVSGAAFSGIHEFNPDARIIVMLRNPVDLVYSMHSQLIYELYEDEKDFETAWDLQDLRTRGECIPPRCRQPEFLQYRELGSLGKQVRRLLDVFPRNQVHFIVFDDFKAATRAVYENTLSFLNVPPDDRQEFPRVNENKRHRSMFLAKLSKWRPKPLELALQGVRSLLGLRTLGGLRQRMKTANRRPVKRPPLSPALRAKVGAAFEEDIRLLESLIGRDLSPWLAENRTPAASRTPASQS